MSGEAMLRILQSTGSALCNGVHRRDFLQAGLLGLTGFGLPQLLQAKDVLSSQGISPKDTAVVWLWLAGGPTHVETFDPKPDAPSEYRSLNGVAATGTPGVYLGGQFPKLAEQFSKLAIVRSFAHTNSGHRGGTHYVMTGYDNRMVDNGGLPTRPSLGAITARHRGANHASTGLPSYVRLGGIPSDGPAFLGSAYAPFDPSGQARKNLTLTTKVDRLDDRRALLGQLDRFERTTDQAGFMEGLDAYEQQAFALLNGSAPKAFDVNLEPEEVRSKYGKDQLAQQMLAARRLVESGCSFVTVSYGGWDMHTQLERGMRQRGPAVDHAVATFLDDLWYRGLHEKVLLVITGEFGRTPRINRNAGRDHWAPLSTLALAGGGLRLGQVIGESTSKAETPKTRPIRPQDLMATVFHHLGIPAELTVENHSGRPTRLLEEGQPIPELLS
jgi:hypothetical protein